MGKVLQVFGNQGRRAQVRGQDPAIGNIASDGKSLTGDRLRPVGFTEFEDHAGEFFKAGCNGLPVANGASELHRFSMQGFSRLQVPACLRDVGQSGQRQRQVTAMPQLPVDRQALLIQRCSLIQIGLEFRQVAETCKGEANRPLVTRGPAQIKRLPVERSRLRIVLNCGRNIREHDQCVGNRVRVSGRPGGVQGFLRQGPRAGQGSFHEGHRAHHLEGGTDSLAVANVPEKIEGLGCVGERRRKVTLLERNGGHGQQERGTPSW